MFMHVCKTTCLFYKHNMYLLKRYIYVIIIVFIYIITMIIL